MAYLFSEWQGGKKPPVGWDCADAVGDGWTRDDLEFFFRATVRPFAPREDKPAKHLLTDPKSRETDVTAMGGSHTPAGPTMSEDASPRHTENGVVAFKRERQRRTESRRDDNHSADDVVNRENATASNAAANVAEHNGHAKDGVSSFWADQFVMNAEGKIMPGVTRNWTLLLENHKDAEGLFAFNEFSGEVTLIRRPPWDQTKGEWTPISIRERDLAEVVEWLEARHMTPKVSNILPVIQKIAHRHPFHPVKGYFTSLPRWDGTSRLDTFLAYYLGTEDTPLNRAIGRKWLCATVRRVFDPGCKFDHVLTLVGAQGMKKSSFGKALVPLEEWVTDAVRVGDAAREVMENTRGKLIVELAELAGKSSREIEAVKQFVSRQTDRARAAYSHLPDEVKRQFVFYATTNGDKPLNDDTGARRWWTVTPTNIDLDALRSDRDQIWAEAMSVYRSEPLWLDNPDLELALAAVNRARTDYGEYYEVMADIMPEGPMIVSASDMRKVLSGGSDGIADLPRGWMKQFKSALAGLGFDAQSFVIRRGKGTVKAYVRGDRQSARWASYSNGKIEFDISSLLREDDF